MIRPQRLGQPELAAALRLSRLAPVNRSAVAALVGRDASLVRARRELLVEGQPITAPMLLLSGWAARSRILSDGRRQFLSFLLPGDLIGACGQSRPLATSTVVALTELVLCPGPAATAIPELDEAYAVSRALDEAYLLRQVTRLGRLNAKERIADLLLEFHERLSLAGLVSEGGFDLPLTQEMMADALGLTPVHVNRMVQLLRREGDLQWRAGRITLPDPAGLARKVDRMPVRVSAES